MERRSSKGRARIARHWMIGWTALAVIALGVLGFIVFRSTDGGGVAPGRPAPRVDLTDFNGEPFSLSDYEGRPVVVNFWASWCPNCIAEMPDFERVHQAAGDEVAFVGINQSDRREAAEELAQATGVTYRLVEDPDARAFQAFGGLGMPMTAFVDADGNIADIVVGQLSSSQLGDYIQRSFEVRVDV